jgi:Plasmid pRiA4b ORF-3-like protein
MNMVMTNVRFRISIGVQEAKYKAIFIPYFEFFFNEQLKFENVRFVELPDKAIPFQLANIQRDDVDFWHGLVARARGQQNAFVLNGWFDSKGIKKGDSILITILNWKYGVYLLEYEAGKQRKNREIEKANREMGDAIFAALEESRDEVTMTHEVIPNIYARMEATRSYPGDHWINVIEKDKRLKLDMGIITYTENLSMFEKILVHDLENPQPRLQDSYSPKQSKDVYRFRIGFAFNPKIWRTIEIKASQKFKEFDRILRSEFGHDPDDHLGGFWKMVRRGQTGKRLREIEIGDVDPLGTGSAAKLRLGGVGLQKGDMLRFVYDFGDWIEHDILLEEIVQVENDVNYPRLVDRNKPKYSYCSSCKSEGRQTIATVFCRTCSNEQQKDVLLCNNCVEKRHLDHWVGVIVY